MVRKKVLLTVNLPLILFLLLTVGFGMSSITSEHRSRNSDLIYSVHFLSETEPEIVIQKCCGKGEVLKENGDCSVLAFDPHNRILETRVRRALEDNVAAQNASDILQDTFIVGFFQQRPSCHNRYKRQQYFDIQSAELKLTSNLQFITTEETKDEIATGHILLISPRDFCVDWNSDSKITVEYCVNPSCSSISNQKISHPKTNEVGYPCLRKCCPANKILDLEGSRCVKVNIQWQLLPITLETVEDKIRLNNEGNIFQSSDISQNFTSYENDGSVNANWSTSRNPLHATWLTGRLNCKHDKYEVYTDMFERYFINQEGYLITEKNRTVAKVHPGEFCFEAVLGSSKIKSQLNGSSENENLFLNEEHDSIFSRQFAFVCFDDDGKSSEIAEEKFNWRWVYTILSGISCIFLLATCIIYVILRKDLNLPGWLQFAYALSLLLTFALLMVAQLWTQWIHKISKSLCRVLGYGLHFFFLSCFFWLTSMNVDLWFSFRSSAIARGFGKSRGKRRFLEFSAFSIGFPAAITLLVFAVDYLLRDNPNMKSRFWTLPTSGIGENSCVIDMGNKVAQLHYFYGFVGILLLINLVIFVCTLISLRNRERETRLAKSQSTSNADYDRLQLFTRLFLIMGILWIFEVISWIFEYFGVNEYILMIFVFTDCLNALQGVAVFIMFVWKPQTWKQLKKKFKAIFGLRGTRPLSRPSYNYTMNSNGHAGTTKSSSMKSSYFSSTKSTDSSRLPSTSAENDVFPQKQIIL